MTSKRILAIFIVFCICFSFCSCGGYSRQKVDEVEEKAWNRGYNAGYSEGYFKGESDLSIDRDDIISESFWEAEQYAIEHSMHPEEAQEIIDCYINNLPYYENGLPPTQADFYKAIDAFIFFYSYYAIGKYE